MCCINMASTNMAVLAIANTRDTPQCSTEISIFIIKTYLNPRPHISWANCREPI